MEVTQHHTPGSHPQVPISREEFFQRVAGSQFAQQASDFIDWAKYIYEYDFEINSMSGVALGSDAQAKISNGGTFDGGASYFEGKVREISFAKHRIWEREEPVIILNFEHAIERHLRITYAGGHTHLDNGDDVTSSRTRTCIYPGMLKRSKLVNDCGNHVLIMVDAIGSDAILTDSRLRWDEFKLLTRQQ